MATFFALLAGAVFGIGLIVSGMADPAKVLGFLDLPCSWDPPLAFVMAGAIAVGVIAFALRASVPVSLLGLQMRMPTTTQLDRQLVAGGVLFGVGWGIAGYCPGLALVAFGMGETKAAVFVVACWSAWGCSSCSSAAARPTWRRRVLEGKGRTHG